MTKENSHRILILSAILLMVAIGVIGYLTQQNVPYYPGPSGGTPSSAQAGVDTNGWTAYTSSNFGFSLKYPGDWQLSDSGIHSAIPYIEIGNPLEGQKTYVLRLWIVSMKSAVSAADYVKALLAHDRAEDAKNAQNGPAPQVTPRFTDEYAVTVGTYPGYELFNVFEFDHNAEQVYVANGKEVLVFDFPIAAENPNLSLPADNNALVRAIVNTLQLTPAAGAFCGGIATFPCPSGYSCKLDGTYPDAGGHCVSK